MVFVTVKDALCAKLTAFVAGVSVPGVVFAYKSSCTESEKYLDEKLDVRMHRLEICIDGELSDFNEMLKMLREENEQVAVRVGGLGGVNNTRYVYIFNIKRFASRHFSRIRLPPTAVTASWLYLSVHLRPPGTVRVVEGGGDFRREKHLVRR